MSDRPPSAIRAYTAATHEDIFSTQYPVPSTERPLYGLTLHLLMSTVVFRWLAPMEITFKAYASKPGVLVGTASFPKGFSTMGCGSNKQLATHFPEVRFEIWLAQHW